TPDSHPSSSAGTKPADLEIGPLLKAAVRAARGFNGDASIQCALLTLARETGLPTDLRLEALAVLPGGVALGAAEYDFLPASHGPETRPGAVGETERGPGKTKGAPGRAARLVTER